MASIVDEKTREIILLCEKHDVSRFVLFGSAALRQQKIAFNDLDFLVEFRPMSPKRHANSFFGLLEDLEQLFGVSIDLVEREPIRNPYFLESIERNQVVIYEAA